MNYDPSVSEISPSSLVTVINRTFEEWQYEERAKSILYHEHVHFFQYIGTFCGQYVSECSTLRTAILIQSAQALGRSQGKLWITFRDWRDDLTDGGQADRPVNETARILNRVVGACDRLDRSLQTLTHKNPPAPWAYMHTQGQSLLGSHYSNVAPPKRSASPTIGTADWKMKLGANQLMESVAYYWETYANTKLQSESALLSEQFDPRSLYQTLVNKWRGKGDRSYLLYVATIEYVCERLGVDALRIFPFIVDLALCGPKPIVEDVLSLEYVSMDPDGNIKRFMEGRSGELDYEYAWEDVHPGWRFIAIVESMVENPYMVTSYAEFGFDPITWYADVDELYEVICEKYGWPMVTDLARQELEKLQSTREQAPLQMYQAKAMQLRVLHPSCFANYAWLRFNVRDLIKALSKRDNASEPQVLLDSLPVILMQDGMSSESDNHELVQRLQNQMIMDICAHHLLPKFSQDIYLPAHYGKFPCPFATAAFWDHCDKKEDTQRKCSQGEVYLGDCEYNRVLQSGLGVTLGQIESVN